MISLGQSSLYASLHLPQTPAEIIPGRINRNRPSSGRSPLEPLEAWVRHRSAPSGRFSSHRIPRIDSPVSPQPSPPIPRPFPLSFLTGALPHAARVPRSGSSGLGPDHPAPCRGKKYCWAGSSGLWADHPSLGTFHQSEAKTFW